MLVLIDRTPPVVVEVAPVPPPSLAVIADGKPLTYYLHGTANGLPRYAKDPDPASVVRDLVLRWSERAIVDERPVHVGAVLRRPSDGKLDLLAGLRSERPHREVFSMAITEGPEEALAYPGEPRWWLNRIAPGVWKPSQSVRVGSLHAYLTLVDVPEPAPWLPAAESPSPPPSGDGLAGEDRGRCRHSGPCILTEGQCPYPGPCRTADGSEHPSWRAEGSEP